MAQNKNLDVVISVKYDGKDADIKINGTKSSIQQLNSAVNNMNVGLNEAGEKLKATGTATGGATATVLELGRAVSDFNYGIRGYANNLSQLVSNFVFMSKRVDETTKTVRGFRGALDDVMVALRGPLGIILVFQTVIAVLESFAMRQKEVKEETKEATAEIEKQTSALNELSAITTPLKNALRTLEFYDRGLISLSETVEILGRKYKDFNAGYEKLSEEQKKDPKTVSTLIKAYEQFVKVREDLSVEMERSVELEKEIDDFQARFKGSENVLRQSDAYQKLTGELKDVQGNILSLLRFENRLAKFFTTVKDSAEENEGDDDVSGVGRGMRFFTGLHGRDVMEMYDEFKQVDFELRRRRLESMKVYSDESRIQASEANNQLLADEVEHQERMLQTLDVGSIERHEAEGELAMMRMDLQDQEFEHEMLLLVLRMQAQLEYVDFVSGLGQVFTTLGKESEALAKVGLVVQKGAAIAGVVIQAQKANAEILSLSAGEIGFYRAAGASRTILGGVKAAAPFLSLAKSAEASAAKRITANNVGAGIAIANILATTLTSRTAPSAGGRAGGGEGGGGRTFDFNLVGTTGTNQLAEAVGAQFQEPIQAYVVSSQITSQQELDLQIETGASLGD